MRFDYSPPIASYRPAECLGLFDVTIDGETVVTVDREAYAKEACATIRRLGHKARKVFGLGHAGD